MNLTDEQHEAIYTHNRNLIVVAGAGSGKTRVLVERYLALLEANPDWRLNQLVAITFTKKAAGEMRDRVRQSLEKRLRDANDEDTRLRWSALLATMDSARIDTIHGLCATILRANAAEAKVDPKFEVLDETEAAILLDDVVYDTLHQLVAERSPALELFEEYKGDSVRQWLANPTLLQANLDKVPDNLMFAWGQAWADDVHVYSRHFLSEIDKLNTVMLPSDADNDVLGKKWWQCFDCLDRLRNENLNADVIIEIFEEIKDIKASGGTEKNWGDKETLTEARDTFKALKELVKETLKQIGTTPSNDRHVDAVASRYLPLWRDLILRVRNTYHEVKARFAQLDFDDLEKRTRDLLVNYSEVRARYQGSEFKHLLVDEFQDTNNAQWEIIKSLANLKTQGSMFVVGDEKQSIYAFRGADVSVFDSVRQEIPNAGGVPLTLSESFRTHLPLIDGFNDIFGKLLVREEGSPVKAYQVELGKPMSAFRKTPPTDAPLIELVLIDENVRDEDGEFTYTFSDTGRQLKQTHGSENCRRWEAYEIAIRLKTMIEDEQRIVFDKEERQTRPMRYDDVAILFQALSHINLYEDVFKAVGVPYVTVGGRGYYNRQEVWDLLNLLRALYNPDDNLSLATALRSPLFGLSDDALLALRLSKHPETEKTLSLWDSLLYPSNYLPDDEREVVAFAYRTLRELRSSAGRVTISELLRDALARTGYLAVLTGLPDGARRRGNVEKLLEIAQSSGKITLSAFSLYLQDLSAREAREGDALVDVSGAVTMMSVHASKGLEYPVIVLADASWTRGNSFIPAVIPDAEFGLACKVDDPDKSKTTKDVPYNYQRALMVQNLREEAERLRLLYVAMTRAQDYLLVTGRIRETNNGWNADGWLGKLFDALSLSERLVPYVDDVDDYEWGQVHYRIPSDMPPERVLILGDDNDTSLWDNDKVQAGEPLSDHYELPVLLNEITIRKEDQATHFAATQIEDMGGYEHDDKDRAFFRDRFRRRILHDAPNHIRQVVKQANQTGVKAYQIGEIVHEVLRWWSFPKSANDDDYKEILRQYAWRQGITEKKLVDDAVDRAYQLLQGFVKSQGYHWLEDAKVVYRELPFIYRQDDYLIHGIIDTLFQRQDGSWVIMDYKTSSVVNKQDNKQKPSLTDMESHARRYHLQLGVYAEATIAQLSGIIPETYIHYIRYNQLVQVSTDEWRSALTRSLSERIVDLI